MESTSPVSTNRNSNSPTFVRNRASTVSGTPRSSFGTASSTNNPLTITKIAAVSLESVAASTKRKSVVELSAENDTSPSIESKTDDPLTTQSLSDFPSSTKSSYESKEQKQETDSPSAAKRRVQFQVRSQSESPSAPGLFLGQPRKKDVEPLRPSNAAMGIREQLKTSELKGLKHFQVACAHAVLIPNSEQVKEHVVKKSLKELRKHSFERLGIFLNHVLNSLSLSQFKAVVDYMKDLESKECPELLGHIRTILKNAEVEHQTVINKWSSSKEILTVKDSYPRQELTNFLLLHNASVDLSLVKWLEKYHGNSRSVEFQLHFLQVVDAFPKLDLTQPTFNDWQQLVEKLKKAISRNDFDPDLMLAVVDPIYVYLDQKYFQTNCNPTFVDSPFFDNVLHHILECPLNTDLALLPLDESHEKKVLVSLASHFSFVKHNKDKHSSQTVEEMHKSIVTTLDELLEKSFKEQPVETFCGVESVRERFIGNWLGAQQDYINTSQHLTKVIQLLPIVLRQEGSTSKSFATILDRLPRILVELSTNPYKAYFSLLTFCESSSTSEKTRNFLQEVLGGPAGIAKLQFVFSSHCKTHLDAKINLKNISLVSALRTERALFQIEGGMNLESFTIASKPFQPPARVENPAYLRQNIDEFFFALIDQLTSAFWPQSTSSLDKMHKAYVKVTSEMHAREFTAHSQLEETLPYTKQLIKDIPSFFVLQACSFEAFSAGAVKFTNLCPEIFQPQTHSKSFTTKNLDTVQLILTCSLDELTQNLIVSQQKSYKFEYDISKEPYRKQFGTIKLKQQFIFSMSGIFIEHKFAPFDLQLEKDAPKDYVKIITQSLAKHWKEFQSI